MADKDEEEKDAIDTLLDEILVAPPEDLEERVLDGEDYDAPDPEPNTDDDDELSVDSEPSADDREDAGELESSDEGGQASDDDDDSPPADPLSTRERAGFLREIAELRKRVSTYQPVQQQLPNTGPVAPPPADTTAHEVPVLVSKDGKSVYVDPEALDRHVNERAQQIVQQASRPSPEQVRIFQNQKATNDFIAADPERRETVATRVREVDDYLTLQVQDLMNNCL